MVLRPVRADGDTSPETSRCIADFERPYTRAAFRIDIFPLKTMRLASLRLLVRVGDAGSLQIRRRKSGGAMRRGYDDVPGHASKRG